MHDRIAVGIALQVRGGREDRVAGRHGHEFRVAREDGPSACEDTPTPPATPVLNTARKKPIVVLWCMVVDGWVDVMGKACTTVMMG